MARKTTKVSAKENASVGEPKFPYTTEPKALRRLLAEIPKRPKPPKITLETLKGWSVSGNSNARTAIAVLKKLELLGNGGEPNDTYVDFMKTGTGPGVLAAKIREIYRVLFENSHAPQDETDEELRKLFNIHSGGGADAMRLQIQTFKALCEFGNFDSAVTTGVATKDVGFASGVKGRNGNDDRKLPPVQVDLHIHLPENKTSRDYEAIIQDIAKYIYGRDIDRN